MTDEINLNETELLLLQQQMEGDVEGLNFSLEVPGANRASFTGGDSGNIHDVRPVEETEEIGHLDTIKFRVIYQEHPQEPRRKPLLSIHSNGKMNCQTPVLPPLLNRIVAQIEMIEEYDPYLDPVVQLTREFIEDKYADRPTRDIDAYILDTQESFKELIEHYFFTSELAQGTIRAYQSIIANLGIAICETGIPDASAMGLSTAGTTSFPIDGEYNEQLQDFFTEYVRRTHGDEIVFSDLVPHLIEILEDTWDGPLDKIKDTIERYDLE